MRYLSALLIIFFSFSIALADGYYDPKEYYKSKDYEKYKSRSARKANPHKKLTGYTGAFYCEKCHPGAIEEVMNSIHYKWAGKLPPNYLIENGKAVTGGKEIGKKYKLGSCPGAYPLANYLGILPDKNGKKIGLGCGKCHVGGGYPPVEFKKAMFEQKNAIECLLCHAEEYDMSKRKVIKVGEKNGKPILRLTQDMSDKALQSVGRPTNEACMRCHYTAGGGPLFKRGVDYADDTDVHAAIGLLCVDCHTPRPRKDHGMVRSLGLDIWNYDHYTKEEGCIKCHPGKIHKDKRYDAGCNGKVACVTCHIKTTGGLMMKDFSQMHQSKKSGFWLFKTIVKDEHSVPVVYKWWDGKAREPFIPQGDPKDKNSKLYVFKKFEQIIPVDKNGNRLPYKLGIVTKMGPGKDENGNNIPDNIEKATLIGVKLGKFLNGKPENPGIKKSPIAGFKKITEYFMVSHGVLPKEEALTCKDCHGNNPVINWKELGMENPVTINQ
ncbi:hypothetical protein FHQ18_05250 [Deferribacter autotrophicus]|uniref:Cytochrome C n=1 Tax=Deferribacter autotrophicus TaxID=500465 RepID=A0A5A8F4Z9_9BACT|nr:hypothetical protein [Deferribacter autotrophicus]KAA0258566.1 hypothetical protein FHQ18_05250 [Deferribacter autotrophicus]